MSGLFGKGVAGVLPTKIGGDCPASQIWTAIIAVAAITGDDTVRIWVGKNIVSSSGLSNADIVLPAITNSTYMEKSVVLSPGESVWVSSSRGNAPVRICGHSNTEA